MLEQRNYQHKSLDSSGWHCTTIQRLHLQQLPSTGRHSRKFQRFEQLPTRSQHRAMRLDEDRNPWPRKYHGALQRFPLRNTSRSFTTQAAPLGLRSHALRHYRRRFMLLDAVIPGSASRNDLARHKHSVKCFSYSNYGSQINVSMPPTTVVARL